ncbi:MAG TPA: PQQ-binding-like beta-propeller repeat protein [Puia sp.]|nr:PQQ-binding-like beta-propeller repeat protein [Puia sp.]
MRPRPFTDVLLFLPLFILAAACHDGGEDGSWPVYGGNAAKSHHSALKQIDTGNVRSLRQAWVYHCGDVDSNSQLQINPIVIGHTFYGVSPRLKLFALDAATGRLKWTFDPARITAVRNWIMNTCRGLAYYRGSEMDQRLFYSAGSFLYCIDALTGKPIDSFGENGRIDLHNDLGRDVSQLYVAGTTPGIIYKDMLIIGDRVAEESDAAPGHIRAYDVHTGRLRWIFHTIPYPGEKGYDTWDDTTAYRHIGGANAWSGFSLDEDRGIVFAPIGSASFDFYGGRRLGNDLFADCVVALDAGTGRLLWHFQTVHHDVWDRDPPTAPVLVTVRKGAQTIPAVAQVTKSGFVFLLDRVTGKPLYPVEERRVADSTELKGERLSPTQPYPTVLPNFARQTITAGDLNRLVPDSSYEQIRKRLAGYHTGWFYPPSREGTIVFPGFDGGAEWGGPSYDPETGVLYVNANEVPCVLTIVDAPAAPPVSGKETVGQAARTLYAGNCMTCHGTNRQGSGNFPSLTGIEKKYSAEQLVTLIASGRRMMPAFKQLSAAERHALADFLLGDSQRQKLPFVDSGAKQADPYFHVPYTITGYNKFLTREGYPATMPPWGTLTAIDLSAAKIVWRDTLGDYPELKARGIHSGTENYGGAAVTAGGLLFIAASSDAKFRAFNKRTGRLLWETDLPACGFATPSVYSVDGREYVVIACGGGKLGKRSGDAYVAFSLDP